MDPLSIIADELKQRERERWLACLYAAAPARPGLFAWPGLDAAQPLLQSLQARALPRRAGADLATLEDGWLARLGGVQGTGSVQLFTLAARLLGADPAEGEYLGRALALAQSPPDRTSVLLRPLRALVELKARDAAHAVAGRPPEPRGTLARQALMFKVVALGR